MIGFSNVGYDGIPVLAQRYVSYFYVKGEYSGALEVQLVGSSSGIVYASQKRDGIEYFVIFHLRYRQFTVKGLNRWEQPVSDIV